MVIRVAFYSKVRTFDSRHNLDFDFAFEGGGGGEDGWRAGTYSF
jgi:hypothetical protein